MRQEGLYLASDLDRVRPFLLINDDDGSALTVDIALLLAFADSILDSSDVTQIDILARDTRDDDRAQRQRIDEFPLDTY